MRFLVFGLLQALSPWVWALPDAHELSCVQDGQNVCQEAKFQLARVPNDHFAKMFEDRREKFGEWIKPVALYVQAATGFPASVLVAQAGVASDWGAGPAFRNSNNIFKHVCWLPKSVVTGEVVLNGRKFSYKGTCGEEKIFGRVGRPLTFASYEDSILAYVQMVIFSPARQFKALQEEIKRGGAKVPARAASFRVVADQVSAFSGDAQYGNELKRLIQIEKFVAFDVPACWQCLLSKSKGATP